MDTILCISLVISWSPYFIYNVMITILCFSLVISWSIYCIYYLVVTRLCFQFSSSRGSPSLYIKYWSLYSVLVYIISWSPYFIYNLMVTILCFSYCHLVEPIPYIQYYGHYTLFQFLSSRGAPTLYTIWCTCTPHLSSRRHRNRSRLSYKVWHPSIRLPIRSFTASSVLGYVKISGIN